jgi:STE24 endopeptidase
MIASELAFSLLFCAMLLAGLAVRSVLASRQIRHVARHRGTVPEAFAQTITTEAHRKAADYTIAKTRFGLIDGAIEAALLLGWTLLGGLDWLNQTLLGLMGGGMWQQLALVGSFVLIGGLLGLPTAWWSTFRIEERFGFNKMGLGLWIADAIKAALVGGLIGLPILALVLWLMGAAGSTWWLWAWGVWMGFNLLMLVFYPTLIAPLFNKFEPLQDEAIKTRVNALMARCGFAASGFFVMDGSKRSAHANAYFTGFGAAKRVVFFPARLTRCWPTSWATTSADISCNAWCSCLH